MILDSLEHASRYDSLGPAFARAFEFLAAGGLDALPEGRHEIDGEAVYAIVASYQTQPAQSKQLEAHRRYADIQVLLRGEEAILWAPLQGLETEVAYQPDKDIVFFRDPAAGSTPLPMRPGLFALFLPWDAHKPGCSLGGPEAVRKLVVKLRV